MLSDGKKINFKKLMTLKYINFTTLKLFQPLVRNHVFTPEPHNNGHFKEYILKLIQTYHKTLIIKKKLFFLKLRLEHKIYLESQLNQVQIEK